MAKLRDKIWLWGHPENCFFKEWGFFQESRMTPMEGCLYLGARNVFMVPMAVKVNPEQYNRSFTTLNRVGWSIVPDGLLTADYVVRQAKKYPNISCCVMDDFVGQWGRFKPPLSLFQNIRDTLHHNPVRPLDLWMVLYTHEYGEDAVQDRELAEYLDVFDGVMMWTWKESSLNQFEEKYQAFKQLTCGKHRMLGLYLYNFGEYREATTQAVLWQLERYRELLLAGEIEGVVLHTNAMADVGFADYEACREWMQQHGDEEIPD